MTGSLDGSGRFQPDPGRSVGVTHLDQVGSFILNDLEDLLPIHQDSIAARADEAGRLDFVEAGDRAGGHGIAERGNDQDMFGPVRPSQDAAACR